MPYRNVEQVARFTAEEIRSVSQALRVESATPERIVLRIPPWEGEAWFIGNPFSAGLLLGSVFCPILLVAAEAERSPYFLAMWAAFLGLFLAFRRFAYARKRVTVFPDTNLVIVSCGSLAATKVASGITKRRVLGYALEIDGIRYALWRRRFPCRGATIASVAFLGRLLTPDRQGAAFSEAHIAPADVPPGVSSIAPPDRAALAAVLRYFSFSSEKLAFRGMRERFLAVSLVNALMGVMGVVTALPYPTEVITSSVKIAITIGSSILMLLNGIYWQVRASRLALVVYAGASSVGVVRDGVETREPLESGLFSFQAWESGNVTELSVDLETFRGIILLPGPVDEAVVERSRSFLKAYVAPRVASPTGPRSNV